MVEDLFIRTDFLGHPRSQTYAVPVLSRPHTLQMEEGNPVAIIELLFKVWLEVGHGAQVAVDEGNASFFCG